MTRQKHNAEPLRCNKRYRVWLEGDMKWSGTRHCIKRKGHKGKHGNPKGSNEPRTYKS